MAHASKTPVLGRDIELVQPGCLESAMRQFAVAAPASALFCNVHMLMLSRDDPALAAAMDHADFVFADGVPVAWLQSRLAGTKAGVLRGYEAMLFLCEQAAERGYRVGFYGSDEFVLGSLESEMERRFPGLDVAFCEAPPFVKGELSSTPQELERINRAGLSYLFVGLGCPKQEKWIYRHASGLNCSLLGVGAAFDWLAGGEPMPPRWMERSGLGWLHRLSRHPLRLWHRYLVYNSRFIWAAAGALRRRRKGGLSGEGPVS